MATYQIPAPTPRAVKGDVTENWKDFEEAWSNYLLATGLDSKLDKLADADGNLTLPNTAGEKQIAATLCSVMGTECLKVMKSLPNLNAEDKKKTRPYH